jgi:hypothetical protein
MQLPQPKPGRRWGGRLKNARKKKAQDRLLRRVDDRLGRGFRPCKNLLAGTDHRLVPIEWSIDGGEPQRLSSWYKYALKFSRAGYVILVDDLPSAEHCLQVRVLSDKNPQSKGTWIRIGAFLVHCPC